MKKKRFSLEQIVGVLKQAEVGVPVVELILLCPIFCTSEIVSVAQLSVWIDSRSRGCGEVGSA